MSSAGITFLDERPRARTRWNTLGILGSVFSVLGIFTLGIVSPIGLGLSMLGLLSGPRKAATFGTLVGALGTGFLLLWGWGLVAGIQAVDTAVKTDETEVALRTGVAKIEEFRLENSSLPEGVEGNMLLIRANLVDAWGEDLRYEPIDKQNYAVRSAGPDKQFDTPDDITRS
jgi:hypothetical protein